MIELLLGIFIGIAITLVVLRYLAEKEEKEDLKPTEFYYDVSGGSAYE